MAPKKKPVKETAKSKSSPKAAESNQTAVKEQSKETQSTNDPNSNLPLWLTEGSTQRDKNVLCENVYLYTPDGKTELVKNQRVQFVNGRKYGLIGANGIGKSTLLKHVYAYDLPNFPKYLRVIYVQQHDLVESAMPVLEFVVQSDEEKKWLESEQERLYQLLENADDEADESSDTPKMTIDEIQEKLDSVTDRLDVMDARRSNTRATAILLGLGFTQKMLSLPIGSLSGGWKQRVALACALFVPSDLLLLDEPTNHLDFGAVRWLEQFLKSCTQTLILVSHDRNFLNTVSTDIIELVDQKLDYYRGDYNSYVKQKEELTRQRRHDWEVQQKKILELKQFIEEAKKSDNPATANSAKSRQLMLDKMEIIEEPITEKLFKFEFPDPGKLDHALIEVNDMSFRYPKSARMAHESNDAVPTNLDSDDEDADDGEPWLIRHATLHMDQSSRIGMLGVNGAGKSTLIKLIKGELQPTEGICRLNPHCRAVTFTQHHLDQLDLNKSPMEYLSSLFPTAKENQIRGVMGRYGFDAAMVQQKIGTLSGGQKSRVAFAILTWKEPHLIIMDEPTNHLDLQTIEALICALKNFKGGVLIVSHDQYFLECVATEFWSFRQPDYQTGIVSKDDESSVQVFYELEEAKPFSYNLIDYEGEGSEKAADRAALMKKAQAVAIAEKKEKQAALLAENPDAAPKEATGPVNRGKKKRKTKRGGGGIEMKELNIEEALAQMKLQDEVANTKLIDIEISESEDENDNEEANDEPVEVEEPKPVEEEEEPVNAQPTKQKKQKKSEKSKKSVMVDEDEDDQSNTQSNDKQKKKGKKSKDESVDEAEEQQVKQKKKKSKKDIDSDDEETEQKADKKKKKSKKVQSDDEEQDDQPKKSKKSKKAQSDDEQDEQPKKSKKSKKMEIDEDADDVDVKESKKSKKSKKAENDDDAAEDKPKKAKKSKKLERDDESNNQAADQDEQPKKAKKSKKVEIVDDADNDEKESKKAKKSKKSKADDDDEAVDEKPKKKKKSAVSDDEADEKPKKSKKSKAGSDDEAAEEKPKKKKKSAAESDNDEEDKPKKKKKSADEEEDKPKKSKKPKAGSDDEAVEEKPKKKKKSAGSDDEADEKPTKSKKKVAGSDDEVDEKPKKKKKSADEEEDKPKKSKKSKADSDDEADEKPKKKKKSKADSDEEADEKPKKSKKKSAADSDDEQPKADKKKKKKSKAADDSE